MKMEVEKRRILIIPESEQDKAYIEDTLGIKKEEDKVICSRVNVMGLSCIAYLEIERQTKK